MEKFLSQYSLTGVWTGEVIFFLILIGIGAGLGFLIGKYRLLSLLAGVYFSSALFSAIPSSILPKDPIFVGLVYVILVLLFTFLDEFLFDVNGSVSEKGWKSVAVGFFAVGAFSSTLISLVGWKTVSDILSKQSFEYLAGPWARLFWLTAPLLFFFIVKRKWSKK